MMIIFDLLAGLLLLFAGRELFWLCVGVVGFVLGVQSAAYLGFPNDLTALMAALCLGIIGAVLAIFFEWVSVVFGVGFLGGGYLLLNIVPPTGFQELQLCVFIIGGVVGLCLMIMAFDVALIFLSSLLGASLISSTFQTNQSVHMLIFVASAVVGVLVQYGTSKNRRVDEKIT